MLDENRRLVGALDLYFLQMDGSRFKVTVIYNPYFLIRTEEKYSIEVSRYLERKYISQFQKIEIIQKEDLDLPNHLSGKTQTYIKLSFSNTNNMNKVRREIANAVKANKEREKSNTSYLKMLSASLSSGSNADDVRSANIDFLDYILDMREYDVPYHVRVSIDLKIFCGQWYNVRCKSDESELPEISARPDILERPEPVVLAYDIETTKLPLKFPDAQTDQIMMISYMIDGQGYVFLVFF